MNHLIDLIDRWRAPKVAVLGDYMLDHYVYGAAERLSPDAPVPVLAAERDEYAPGGASNVSRDLAALRAEVRCIGLVGDDEAASHLARCLADAGCDTSGLVVDKSRPTTLKRSYIGLAQHRHPQKMFRVDIEDRRPVDDDGAARLVEQARGVLGEIDVLCIEDYNKGAITEAVCRQVIELCRDAGVPVIVDPAAIDDYARYRGATAITPNRTEAALATGMAADSQAQLAEVARRLVEDVQIDVAVVTADRHGALLLERGEAPVQVPTVARSVYDVTGAGDMVLAALAAARANGAPWRDAVELANVAAGLEVEKFGVVPIPLEELHLHLLQRHHATIGKLRTPQQLAPEVNAHRLMGKKIAFTNGCFDILHAGHVELLRGARATADLLVLAVNTDASISALKGPSRPIVNEQDRVKVLSELECVDYIVLFGDGSGGDADTPRPLLELIKPDVLVKGGTYSHDEVVGWQIVEAAGGRVVTIEPVEGRSTTNIVETIRARNGD